MNAELTDRLRALEHQAEALALQSAALHRQVAALVSEAEHGAVVERAGENPQPAGFYGDFPAPTLTKAENTTDATPNSRRARRSP